MHFLALFLFGSRYCYLCHEAELQVSLMWPTNQDFTPNRLCLFELLTCFLCNLAHIVYQEMVFLIHVQALPFPGQELALSSLLH